ncbi:MAG TPA: short-chain dehydrogenase, partial [Acinetobacter johnsonii]|nr:short-chain dehydrogenase [Acinetobacter johnsonii]
MFEKNKRAIVVGTSRGIGLGLVRELLNQHWHVIATIRDINQVSTRSNKLLSEYPDRFELTELNLNHVQTVD